MESNVSSCSKFRCASTSSSANQRSQHEIQKRCQIKAGRLEQVARAASGSQRLGIFRPMSRGEVRDSKATAVIPERGMISRCMPLCPLVYLQTQKIIPKRQTAEVYQSPDLLHFCILVDRPAPSHIHQNGRQQTYINHLIFCISAYWWTDQLLLITWFYRNLLYN